MHICGNKNNRLIHSLKDFHQRFYETEVQQFSGSFQCLRKLRGPLRGLKGF